MNARQKNTLSLLAVVGVAVGLGLFAFREGREPPVRDVPEPQAPTAILEVPDSGTSASAQPLPVITWLSLDVPQGKTVLERRGTSWRVVSPRPGPADQRLVDTLARELAEAKFKATLEQHPTDADLERYGLKTPRATVSARIQVPDPQDGGTEDPSRQHTLTLRVGGDNSFDGSLYVQRDGDPRVYLAHGALRLVLFKNTDGWRDSQLFPALTEGALLRIVVKARRNQYTLERLTSDRPWEMVRPVKLPADRQRVEKMLADLGTYQAFGHPDEQREALVRQALEKPTVEATFVPSRGESLRVRFAQVDIQGKPLTFVLSEGQGEPRLAQVDPFALDVLDLPPLAFKSRKLLTVDGTVSRIVIRPAGRGTPIILEANPETSRWELVSPLPSRAKQFVVASLLGALQRIEAANLVESQPKNWARYGITDASAGVALLDGTGQLLARLWVGSPVPDKTDRLWVRGSSEDVMELPKATLDALPLTVEELVEGLPPSTATP